MGIISGEFAPESLSDSEIERRFLQSPDSNGRIVHYRADGWVFTAPGLSGIDHYSDERVVIGLDGHLDFPGETLPIRDQTLGSLAHRYASGGESGLADATGSFSLFLYDLRNQSLILMRDAAGSRSLYYGEKEGRITGFSSSLNALIHGGRLTRELSPEAISYYLSFLAIPDPSTIYRHVFQVKAGSFRRYHASANPQERIYFAFPSPNRPRLPEIESIESLRKSLIEAVVRYSDYQEQPVCLLSGGFDTTAITGIISRYGSKRLRTVTIGYGGEQSRAFNEFDFAQQVSRHFGTDHHEFTVTAADLRDNLIHFTWHLEQPSGDAINNYLACSVASRIGTRILTGFGGDEIFIGSLWYRQFLRIQRFCALWRRFPGPIRSIILRVPAPRQIRRKITLLDRIAPSGDLLYRQIRFLFSEEEMAALFAPSFHHALAETKSVADLCGDYYGRSQGLPDLERFMAMLMNHEVSNIQLRDLQAMAKAHGAEALSPLVDRTILDSVLAIPTATRIKGNVLRYPMIRAIQELWPESTLQRKKMSFVVPLVLWVRDELRPVITRLLDPISVERRGHFRPEVIDRMVSDCFTGKATVHPFKIWHLALLELWERIHIDHNFSSPPSGPIGDLL
jgi:asparagine synthase (glutamine-hydrolysing)